MSGCWRKWWSWKVGAVIAVALVSCSSARPSGPPEATASAPPESPTASTSIFESERHSYRLEVPAGWDVTEYGGTWTSVSQFVPGAEIPGEDVVSSPDGAFLVINSMVIPKGMTSRDWLAKLDRLVAQGRDPSCSVTSGTDVLAAERARVVEHRCEEITLVGRSLVNGGRGYYFTIGYPADDLATEEALERILASTRFVG
jgi:hypothetical protein